MKTLIVLSLLLTGCAHTHKTDPSKTADMGGVSVRPCGPNDCGKPAQWEVL